ncbi:MAG: Ig-like domain-containing protein, partial [Spirochaetes bacterium]|nr:Ig-like domain-containing protein [Spirochaetota bacterium]
MKHRTESATPTPRQSRTIAATLAALFVLMLSSCPALFTGDDLKSDIQSDVEVANAESVTIAVRTDPAAPGGAPTPNGSSVQQKVGVPFTLTASPFTAYGFSSWTWSPASAVTVADPDSASTTATVVSNVSGIAIMAQFTPLPIVTESDPYPYQPDVSIAKIIGIQFNKPLDEDTVTLANMEIKRKKKTGTDEPLSIKDKFEEPTLDTASHIKLKLKSGEFLGDNSYIHTISVTINSSITDLYGNSMQSPYTFSFYTSTAAVDSEAPSISSVELYKDSGRSTLITDSSSNSTVFYVEVNATDASDITLIDVTDTAFPGTPLYHDAFATPPAMTTCTIADLEGTKTISVKLMDALENWSVPFIVSFTYDKAPPASVTDLTATAIVAGKVRLDWTEPADVDYKQVNITWTGGSQSVAKGTTTFTTGALTNGSSYTFTFKTQDNAGNVEATGVTAGPVTADSTAPGNVPTRSATAIAAGKVRLDWTEPADADFKQVNITWTGGGSQSVEKGTTTFTTGALTNGTSYTFTFKTQDNAGNEATGVTASATADNVPPTVTITAPAADAVVNGTQALTFTVTGGTATTTARIGIGTLTAFTSGSFLNTLNGWAGTVDGTVTVTLSNTDAAGNTGTATRDFTRDTAAPASVTDLTATAIAAGKVRLDWTEPADTDYKQANITWTGATSGSATVLKGTATYDTVALTNGGSYTFTVKTQDNAGNVEATGVNAGPVTADSTAPGNVPTRSATAIA